LHFDGTQVGLQRKVAAGLFVPNLVLADVLLNSDVRNGLQSTLRNRRDLHLNRCGGGLGGTCLRSNHHHC